MPQKLFQNYNQRQHAENAIEGKLSQKELAKLDAIGNQATRTLKLFGMNSLSASAQPIAELLVVVSARDSIIAVPCGIIPKCDESTGLPTGELRFFKKRPGSDKRPPSTLDNGVTSATAHLDEQHIKEPGARFMLLRVTKANYKYTPALYTFYKWPDEKPGDCRRILRQDIIHHDTFHSPPAFELNPRCWYSDLVLKSLGKFCRGSALPLNLMTKYRHYMHWVNTNIDQGWLFRMYANDASFHTQSSVVVDPQRPGTVAQEIKDARKNIGNIKHVFQPRHGAQKNNNNNNRGTQPRKNVGNSEEQPH